MATVYLALDPNIQRLVAIKVLPRQFTHDPKYLVRFQQEAKTIATLEHPAIVPVYDFGEHNDAPFLVMRYMSGGTLDGRLQGEALPLEDIAAMLERLAPALDYAHEVGVIHRDLKPANILFDHQNNPYLADFGIARLAEATQTMTMIGTPAYMSPEQVESVLKLDGRSDIYALGVMLYELLAGEPPYKAETPTGQMLMHITKPIPDVQMTGLDLPPGTQGVVNKAMAKDREERYQSAAELAEAVQGLVALEMTPGKEAAVEAGLVAGVVGRKTALPEPAVDDIPGEAEAAAAPQSELGEPDVAVDAAPAGPPTRMEVQVDTALKDGAEKVLLYTPPEKTAEEQQVAEPISAATLPADAGRKSGGLPGWIWWVGALALLVIAGLGIRAIMGGAGNEVNAVPAAAIPTEEASGPAGVEVTRVVTETNTKEIEVTRVVEDEKEEGTAAEPVEKATETPKAAETPTEVPGPSTAVDAETPPLVATLGGTWTRPIDGMTMVYVPEGSFPMGSEEGDDDEKPVHEVSLDAFWIDRTEVTNAKFAQFVEATGHETMAEKGGGGYAYSNGEWQKTEGADWQHPSGPGSDLNGLEDHPVVHVFSYDAEAYCEWAGARLPSEAEWEYAARGPEGLIFPWGDGFDGEKTNFCDVNCPFDHADQESDDGYAFTAPVGSYPEGESWSGALDMSGNVWEWVNDWYNENYYADSPERNPQGPDSGEGKRPRGGGWNNKELELLSSQRFARFTNGNAFIGLRCAVSPGS